MVCRGRERERDKRTMIVVRHSSKTDYGKVVTMIYAIFGIPLMLLCLANMGSTMADAFRFIYRHVCCSYCNLVEKRRNLRALQSVELPGGGTAAATPNHTTNSPHVVEFVDNFNRDYRKRRFRSVSLSRCSPRISFSALFSSASGRNGNSSTVLISVLSLWQRSVWAISCRATRSPRNKWRAN